MLFNVNMLPYDWMNINTYIYGRKSSRDRNRNIRDRLLEIAYYPDLSTPISPNRDIYTDYIANYNRVVLDDNVANNFQGNIKIGIDLIEGLKFNTNFMIDYSESRRDLFYPKDFMETINYQSGFFSFSQRFIYSNSLTYTLNLDKSHLQFLVGSDYQQDLYRFYFARSFDGPNDYIKLNIVTGDPQKGDYLQPRGGIKVLRWNNKERLHMQSFYGSANYDYNNSFDIKAVLRWDGASTIQRDSRWILTPALSLGWNVANSIQSNETFKIKGSFGRIALPNYDSKFAMGPQYTSGSIGWLEEPRPPAPYEPILVQKLSYVFKENSTNGWDAYHAVLPDQLRVYGVKMDGTEVLITNIASTEWRFVKYKPDDPDYVKTITVDVPQTVYDGATFRGIKTEFLTNTLPNNNNNNDGRNNIGLGEVFVLGVKTSD